MFAPKMILLVVLGLLIPTGKLNLHGTKQKMLSGIVFGKQKPLILILQIFQIGLCAWL
jgi:hypothetical protein